LKHNYWVQLAQLVAGIAPTAEILSSQPAAAPDDCLHQPRDPVLADARGKRDGSGAESMSKSRHSRDLLWLARLPVETHCAMAATSPALEALPAPPDPVPALIVRARLQVYTL
jgi:hypothetical protein